MKWISVAEGLPEENQSVLVHNSDGVRLAHVWDCRGEYFWSGESDTCGCCDYFDDKGVTHWMPLPEPPDGP